MLNCRESTRLASDRLERRLSMREQFGYRMHILVCPFCCRFAQQVAWMKRLLRRASQLSETELQELGHRQSVGRERFFRSLRDG